MTRQTKSMGDSWWPKPPDNFLDEFVSEGPELLHSATVCGRSYKCRDVGGRVLWQRTDSPDFNSSLPNVEKCRIDSLAAASKAMGTCKPLRQTPDVCKKSSYPILSYKENGSETFVHFSADESRVRGLPLLIDATLQCVAEDVRKQTHTRLSTVEVGSLKKHEFEKRLTPIKEEELPPPPPPPPPPKADPVPEPPKVEKTTSEQIFEDAEPKETKKEETVAADSIFEPPKPEPVGMMGAGWKKCKWFSGSVETACNTDSDCPLEESKAFDAWFDTVEGTSFKGDKMKASVFLQKVNSTFSRTKMKVGTALSNDKMTRVEMRTSLMNAYDSDDTFKQSVLEAIRTEPKLVSSKQTANAGVCVNRKCSVDGMTVRPTTRLYTAKSQASFQRQALTDVITYNGDENVKVNAVKCTTQDAHPLCSEDDANKVVDLVAPKGKPTITLTPSTVTSVPGYRLKFEDVVYAVENTIQVEAGTENAPSVCAQMLCSKNAHACPAPYCKLDGKACVPDESSPPPTLV
jgi:hypothetical protein